MTDRKELDFIVIGAGRSGTTSLFHYLKSHPDIYMPPHKELHYFLRDHKYQKGLAWYYDKYFEWADEDQLWGEASPGYMTDSKVPQRIHETYPDIQMIALLRNPIDRADSHFNYDYTQGKHEDPSSFEELIIPFIQNGETMFSQEQLLGKYLRDGEYGRILSEYLHYFSRDQLLVLFSDNLKSNRSKVIDRVSDFLGVSDAFQEEVVKSNYNEGGEKRFQWLEYPSKLLKSLLKRIAPAKSRAFRFWWKTEFSVGSSDRPPLSDEAREILVNYYEEDIKELEETLDITVPWEEF